ncbi:UDP-glycosyltransferase 73C3 [Acorus calamus]|uniref:Glycosyltransferase n=1 Tax=Acorus calamus TaxID=4465 RepID=A0AAV9EFL1_ACOCL|nr:UDP-glycosyltransferase 73C3 [Acorus calamus]
MKGPNNPEDLHFLLLPFMAPGHMLPMSDIAVLLALRGASVTLITTPLNAARLRPTLSHHHPLISLVALPFLPAPDSGLPDGCESFDALPSRDHEPAFFRATESLLAPTLRHLRAPGRAPPRCVIADAFLPWAREIAREFRAPRLVFHGCACFATLCFHNLIANGALARVGHEREQRIIVPGMPHEVEITQEQLQVDDTRLDDLRVEMWEAGEMADGVVVNSFEELEHEYLDVYREATGKDVWMIGPVSLSNKNPSNTMDRGGKASTNELRCLDWLDQREPKSVIYVSFGSIGRLSPPQTAELARALESSGRNFMWVIKGGNNDNGLPEEFKEEPITERRMVVHGWAPQVAILSHGAVGGFVTHCGWNSTLEGVCAGVPMVAWPLFAEQFLNEKLVVDVLRVGVRVGVERPSGWAGEGVGVVGVEAIERALEEVMDGGKEGVLRRMRARELGEMARKAVEVGGSSYVNMTRLIDYVSEHMYVNDDGT